MVSRFSCVEDADPEELFALLQAYNDDTHPNKVDLGLGAYKTDEGKPWVLPVVRKVEKSMAEDETLDHEYLPLTGFEEFTEAATRLLLGEDSPAIKENRVLGVQTLSGTGGLRIGAEFLSRCAGLRNIYVSSPTWQNHHYVFSNFFNNCYTYRYWNASKKILDFQGMFEDLEAALEDSVILLQASAHNPTGVDPTQEEWMKLAELMEKKKLLPFFDCAYQGLASGDLHKDSWPVRLFVSRGFELLCAQCFDKNIGLYDERIGNLTIVFKDQIVLNNCRQQIRLIIASEYLTPPCNGSRIVARVLNNPILFKEWQNHLKEMTERIQQTRRALKQKLVEMKTPGEWDHVTNQIGMFSYTGLSRKQLEYLREEYHIYLSKSSRLCICGINTKNIDYVARAIHDAVIKFGSKFSCVEAAPPVEIFALSQAYKNDTNPNKVDLGIGAYRTDEGKPWVLPVVRKTEKAIAEDDTLNHEYLGQIGLEEFTKAASHMLLGEDSTAIKENRVLGVQTLSGTGALRVGAEFLSRCAGFKHFYMSSPTWPNHRLVFTRSGFENCHTYRYWNAAKRNLDFDGMLEDLENAPEDSVIILHACAHNPTGIDPTKEQWEKIADLMERKKLFPFFDCAYQGFASGDLVKDSWSVRYFISRGFELLCAQSFAKNFGLYNERAGNLTLVFKDSATIVNSRAQITLIVRSNYSNPPCHGVRIVSKVLNDPTLFEEWQGHIKEMSGRIIQMRAALKQKLDELKTPGTWEHITNQIGMFSYTGLSQEQVKYLVEEYHIYLPKDARISICGLNTKNVEYVAKAIHDAVTKFGDKSHL